MEFILPRLAQQLTSGSTPADVWLGIVGLAFTVLVAGLTLAYRLGRNTQALTDLKETTSRGLADLKADVGAVESRVETFLMRAWTEQGRRDS